MLAGQRLFGVGRQWFAQRVGEAKGRIRRIAVVALARKLMVALWRYLETGLMPEGMNAAS